MNRLIKLVIAIAAISLLAIVVSAETVNGISVSNTELSNSEEFRVEITIPPAENSDTASLKVEFDENAFEVVEWNPEIAGGIANSGAGFFSLSAANVERKIDLSGGMTFSARMKVKDEASGEYSINLVKNSFCYVMDNGYEFMELWFPETFEAVVNVAGTPDLAGDEINNENGDNNLSVVVILGAVAVVVIVAGLVVFKRKRRD